MNNSDEIKKVYTIWLKNIYYIFTGMLITLFLVPFGFELEKFSTETGAMKILDVTFKMLKYSVRPVSYLFIFIFLCLIIYTSCVIFYIVRKEIKSYTNEFGWRHFTLLSLFNSIFIALISLIGIHCLTGEDIKVWHPFWINFLCQFILLYFFILPNNKLAARIKKKYKIIVIIRTSIVLILFEILFWINCAWVIKIIMPIINYCTARFNSFKILSPFFMPFFVIFLFFCIFNILVAVNKKTNKEQSIVAWLAGIVVLYLSSSVWAYGLFSWFSKKYSRTVLMSWCLRFVILVPLINIVYQIILHKEKKLKAIARLIFLNIVAILFVGGYTLAVSINQENRWEFVYQFFSNVYSVSLFLSTILTATALDIVFCFLLTVILGYVVYNLKSDFTRRDFRNGLIIGCLAIFANEMIVQNLLHKYHNFAIFFPNRTGSIGDVVNDTIGGVLIGLLLVRKSLGKSGTF